jgi:hypothetical protein
VTGEALALVLAPAAGIALSPFAASPAILILLATLASISVALPWLTTLVAGAAARRPALLRVQSFLERHNEALTATVLGLLGLLLLYKGISAG